MISVRTAPATRFGLAALAAAGLLLGAGACSSDKASETAAPATPAAAGAPAAIRPSVDPKVAASADHALSSDTKAICAQADRTSSSFGTNLIADLKLQKDAKGKGGQAAAQAKQKLDQDVSNFSFALGDMAKLAGNATLKSTLSSMSQQVKAFSGDPTKINAAKLSQLSGTLDKACGKG